MKLKPLNLAHIQWTILLDRVTGYQLHFTYLLRVEQILGDADFFKCNILGKFDLFDLF